MEEKIEEVTIRDRLKQMADVYRETSGDLYDAFSIQLFSDGSGNVLDGIEELVVEFSSLPEFFTVTEQWILAQYPKEMISHFYDVMLAIDIERNLAEDVANLLTGAEKVRIPFEKKAITVIDDTIIVQLNDERKIHIDFLVEEGSEKHGC